MQTRQRSAKERYGKLGAKNDTQNAGSHEETRRSSRARQTKQAEEEYELAEEELEDDAVILDEDFDEEEQSDEDVDKNKTKTDTSDNLGAATILASIFNSTSKQPVKNESQQDVNFNTEVATNSLDHTANMNGNNVANTTTNNNTDVTKDANSTIRKRGRPPISAEERAKKETEEKNSKLPRSEGYLPNPSLIPYTKESLDDMLIKTKQTEIPSYSLNYLDEIFVQSCERIRQQPHQFQTGSTISVRDLLSESVAGDLFPDNSTLAKPSNGVLRKNIPKHFKRGAWHVAIAYSIAYKTQQPASIELPPYLFKVNQHNRSLLPNTATPLKQNVPNVPPNSMIPRHTALPPTQPPHIVAHQNPYYGHPYMYAPPQTQMYAPNGKYMAGPMPYPNNGVYPAPTNRYSPVQQQQQQQLQQPPYQTAQPQYSRYPPQQPSNSIPPITPATNMIRTQVPPQQSLPQQRNSMYPNGVPLQQQHPPYANATPPYYNNPQFTGSIATLNRAPQNMSYPASATIARK